MPLVSSLILPHGAMVFDGGEGFTAEAAKRIHSLPETLKADCQTLFRATKEAAEMAKATKPDVIFLNTPHGICLSNYHCVYLNTKGKGNAEWLDQWKEYDVNVSLDSELAGKFLQHLQKEGVKAEGMVSYTVCEAPLRWGEVIPLWFFRDLTAAGMKVVIFSNPFRQKHINLSETIKVGNSVANFFNGLEQRVLYVVSGDLAHTHKTDCTMPLYVPDPRWNTPLSELALPFDLCIEHWIRCSSTEESSNISGPPKTKERHSSTWDYTNVGVADRWLAKADNWKSQALSCGIYGFGLLHGILSAEVEKKASFSTHMFCRLAPTYYGMVVAAFIKN